MSILRVNKISKVYGKQPVLDRISFSIESGEFVGIMGPSGSGKTTLLRSLGTLDRPTYGEVWIKDESTFELQQENLSVFRRKKLGFVFQQFDLLDTLTVEENILLPLILNKNDIPSMKQRLQEVTTDLGIENLLKMRIDSLSGGQKQKAAIARAIIHRPDLLLADEPTGNLDSKASREIMEIFNSLHKQNKTTILLVTHDPVIASYCDRLLFLKDGQLYNEIYKGDDQKGFFQKILDMLALLGGDRRDFYTINFPKYDS
ncbi:ATP-binding cassette domain-containing protein [Shimazuella alba]|uniref:ATP-binding cassette domain-containing protein n=1 Tax=Shimazuella alba TaxID=2690964 RepID=A0A6I4VUJ9_9BACL|nr:ATP-binding cassette domain-containing protein [Shimazuella alba]